MWGSRVATPRSNPRMSERVTRGQREVLWDVWAVVWATHGRYSEAAARSRVARQSHGHVAASTARPPGWVARRGVSREWAGCPCPSLP